MSNLAERIQAERIAKGLTTEKLAFTAGLSVSTVQRAVTGKYDPSLSTLEAIAQALDTTAAELLSAPAESAGAA